jgi:hypothetical protein
VGSNRDRTSKSIPSPFPLSSFKYVHRCIREVGLCIREVHRYDNTSVRQHTSATMDEYDKTHQLKLTNPIVSDMEKKLKDEKLGERGFPQSVVINDMHTEGVTTWSWTRGVTKMSVTKLNCQCRFKCL